MAASDIVVLDSNGEVSKVALTKDVVASPDEEEQPDSTASEHVVSPSGAMHVPFTFPASRDGSTAPGRTSSDPGGDPSALSPETTGSTVESVEVLEEDVEPGSQVINALVSAYSSDLDLFMLFSAKN